MQNNDDSPPAVPDKALMVLDSQVCQAIAPVQRPTSGMPASKNAAYYAKKAYSENTYRAYRASLDDFIRWTGLANPFPTTALLITTFLAERAGALSPNTLQLRVHALSFIHRLFGFADPTTAELVKAVLKGIRKDRAADEKMPWSPDQAPTFSLEQLQAMVRAMGDTDLRDLRDKAYLLMGLFGAFRQSELCRVQVRQLGWLKQGLAVAMGPVKQDPLVEAKRWKAIPYGPKEHVELCPVRAVKAWLKRAGVEEGAVFRGVNKHGQVMGQGISHTTANRIVRTWVKAAELEDKGYSGHSLRASFVTVARDLGIVDPVITRQTHHRNVATLNVYDRPQDAFRGNPAVEIMAAWEKCATT